MHECKNNKFIFQIQHYELQSWIIKLAFFSRCVHLLMYSKSSLSMHNGTTENFNTTLYDFNYRVSFSVVLANLVIYSKKPNHTIARTMWNHIKRGLAVIRSKISWDSWVIFLSIIYLAKIYYLVCDIKTKLQILQKIWKKCFEIWNIFHHIIRVLKNPTDFHHQWLLISWNLGSWEAGVSIFLHPDTSWLNTFFKIRVVLLNRK